MWVLAVFAGRLMQYRMQLQAVVQTPIGHGGPCIKQAAVKIPSIAESIVNVYMWI